MQTYSSERTVAETAWSVTCRATAAHYSVSVLAADAETGVAVAEASVEGHPQGLLETRRALLEGIDVLLGPAAPVATPVGTPAARLAALRARHPRAYQPWTADDDVELESSWAAGATVGELSTALGRGRGAIQARLEKLGHDPSLAPALRAVPASTG